MQVGEAYALEQGLLLLLVLLQRLLHLPQLLLRQLCELRFLVHLRLLLLLLLLLLLQEPCLNFHELARQPRAFPRLVQALQLFHSCSCQLDQRIAHALHCGVCSCSLLQCSAFCALPAAAAAAADVAAADRQ
jgi:hypothetical protein